MGSAILPGISPISVGHIPEQWSAAWFRSFIQNHLQNADVRNSTAGSGISVKGTVGTPATISATGGVGPNSITNADLAQGPPLTVKGNATNITSNEQDIAASAGSQFLQSDPTGTFLEWGSPPNSGIQLRGATWSAANQSIQVSQMSDVSIIVPQDCTITRCTILTKGGTGSCEVDIWTSPIASYPPTVANSICPANHPIISSGIDHDDSTLTGFNTTLPAGNVLTFHLVSSSVFTEIVITLALTPSGVNAPTGYTNAQAVAAVQAALANTGNVIFTNSGGSIIANTGLSGNPWGPNQSITASGSQPLPSGLILKWGSTAYSGAGTSVTQVFANAFPTACFLVIPVVSVSGFNAAPSSFTASQVVFSTTQLVGTAMTIYWVALGN